jgi:hypothetical protein
MAWFDAEPKRQVIDEVANHRWDLLISAYQKGLENAVRGMG